ncbi:hypothetical protein EC973_003018 [Apophysomyces ossiformis]|uniref:Helicase ATP-binding domain-containing protein n=1 Tax=Apophysomyces ossiformis TaxID=679940 RepID=A0A8H7BTV0_9FUNG|nr:hypothetical protein EC973_003018 [Apophysomyces ossiformis]
MIDLTGENTLGVNNPPTALPQLHTPSPSVQPSEEEDSEVIIDEEMTNRNVCIGMMKTDIVTLKALDLIKDEQYEPIRLESEGKRDAENYSFTVTSRGIPRKFYGWVPFEDTKVLGPLVDSRLVWWDAVIPRGRVKQARTPLYIILYCRPHHVDPIARFFESCRTILQEPPFFNPACRYKNPHVHLHDRPSGRAGRPCDRMLESQDERTRRDIAQLLDSIPDDTLKRSRGQDKNDPIELDDEEKSNVEEEDLDLNIDGLNITLMPHQARGVAWMIDRETNESSCGGILADMGLGKTIQTIALVVSTMASPRRVTLIVTPLALIQQWATEIRTKTKEDGVKVLVHHGPNRTKDPAVFLEYDVIVTTYQVVASDMPSTEKRGRGKKSSHEESQTPVDSPQSSSNSGSTTASTTPVAGEPMVADDEQTLKPGYGPLFQVKWYRVVLDEAQQIKNRNTRSAISCSELTSEKRWCLTGTPIQNHVDELYSLLAFLRIQPLADYSTFRKTISLPIQLGQGKLALERLKVVLMAVMLRRTKDVLNKDEDYHTGAGAETGAETPSQSSDVSSSDNDTSLSSKLSLQLPSKAKKDVVLEFSEAERALYDLLTTKTRNTVEKIFRAGKGDRNYLNMLCMLLRLRQACDHPQLVLKSVGADTDALELATENVSANNQRREAREASEAITERLMMAKMATDLGWQGVGQVGQSVFDKSSMTSRICELCGRSLGTEQAGFPFCKPCLEQVECYTTDRQNQRKLSNSTKINKMLEILIETRRDFPTEKTIIFSQFTSMLDLMEEPLMANGFKLNLTAANRVILTDIWWNPAVEEQAIDRVHRIGQKLPVQVTRLIMDKTIEQKIVLLQQRKAQIAKGALGDGMIRNSKLTTKEIRSLFDL